MAAKTDMASSSPSPFVILPFDKSSILFCSLATIAARPDGSVDSASLEAVKLDTFFSDRILVKSRLGFFCFVSLVSLSLWVDLSKVDEEDDRDDIFFSSSVF